MFLVEAAVESNCDILLTVKDSNHHVLDSVNQTLIQNGTMFISIRVPQGHLALWARQLE